MKLHSLKGLAECNSGRAHTVNQSGILTREQNKDHNRNEPMFDTQEERERERAEGYETKVPAEIKLWAWQFHLVVHQDDP